MGLGGEVSWSARKDDSSACAPSNVATLCGPTVNALGMLNEETHLISPTSNELRLRKLSDLLSELQQWSRPSPPFPSLPARRRFVCAAAFHASLCAHCVSKHRHDALRTKADEMKIDIKSEFT